jgi:hypothetical protein
VARAKRTDRAEARRRYRAASAGEGATQPEGASPGIPGAVRIAPAAIPRDARARTAPPRPGQSAAPERMGLVASLRAAYGQADVIGDIKALPQIALHSKAIWLPGLLIVGSGLLMQLVGTSGGPIVQLLVSLVLSPPPMIIAFLAGIFAPRGAWLVGGLMSTFAAVVYVALTWTWSDISVTPLGWTYVPTDAQKWAFATSILIPSPVFGVAVGAFAGFYRRFLNIANPNRGQPQARRRR